MPRGPANEALQGQAVFFDIPGHTIPAGRNVSRKIDALISRSLYSLPIGPVVPQAPPAVISLAERNLLRGKRLGLPSYQDVAEAMGIIPYTNAQLGLKVLPKTHTSTRHRPGHRQAVHSALLTCCCLPEPCNSQFQTLILHCKIWIPMLLVRSMGPGLICKLIASFVTVEQVSCARRARAVCSCSNDAGTGCR
jgi:hypothetical protein